METPPRSAEQTGLQAPPSPKKRPRSKIVPMNVRMWLSENRIPLHKQGYVSETLFNDNQSFECRRVLRRCVVEFYTSVVVKRRPCTSKAHDTCGVSCIQQRCRDLSFLEQFSDVQTPRLEMFVAEANDDGEIEVVSVQRRALPLATPLLDCESVVSKLFALVREIGALGIVHGDIRIDNIVMNDGMVMLIDWECASRPVDGEPLSDIGTVRWDAYDASDWRNIDAHAAIEVAKALLSLSNISEHLVFDVNADALNHTALLFL